MTEAEQVLRQTNRQRSIVKRSARYKKGGSKSRKCTLPHEYLTRKELKAMNGPCRNYQLRNIYTWEEFVQMPHYVQVDYINHYIEKFNVGMTVLATHLFGRCRTSLYMYCKKHNLLGQIHEKKGRPCTKREVEALKEYVAREKNTECKDSSGETVIEEPLRFRHSGQDLPIVTSDSVPVEPEASNSVAVEEPPVVTPDSVLVEPEASNSVTIEEYPFVTPVPILAEAEANDETVAEEVIIDSPVSTKDEDYSDFRARYDTDCFNLDIFSELAALFAGRKARVFFCIETRAPKNEYYRYFQTQYRSEKFDMTQLELLCKIFSGLKVSVNIDVKYIKDHE